MKKEEEEKASQKKKEAELAAKKTVGEKEVPKKANNEDKKEIKKPKTEITPEDRKKNQTETTTKDNKKDTKKNKMEKTADDRKKGTKMTETESSNKGNKSKTKSALSSIFKMKEGKGFFWATADVYRENPVEYVIFSMRDFVFYSMFMVLTGLIAFGDLDYQQNYYGNVVSEVLTNSNFVTNTGKTKTFMQIHEIPEIWAFIKAVLLKGIHNAYYQTYEDFEGFKVLTESILVGSPRLRQKRVKGGTCRTAPMFQDMYRSCYDYYADDVEDKADFGGAPALTASAWKYSHPVEDELGFRASASQYGAGGFVMNFSSDVNLTSQWLEELENNLWIRLGSRAVFIELTLYSPNANLFCTVKLVFEILPSGGVNSDAEIITSKLWHESNWAWFLFGCKIIFSMYTVYFTLEEITQIVILKERYLSNWWNILDTTIFVMCYIVIIFNINHFKNVSTLNGKIHNVFNPEYSSFDRVARSLAAHKLVTALLVFFVWLKLFKFAVISKTTAFLLSTFNTALMQIVVVTLTMIGIISGFAILGTIVLDEVLQFRSVTQSFFTLYGLFVGGLYFLQTNKTALNREAKIYLAAYIIFVLVIFSCTYVAIIVNGFRKAVFELEDDRSQVYFGDVWNALAYKITHFWKNKKKTADALYRREADKMITKNFEELLEILRRRGCRGMELALLLKKHNVRPGAVVPFDTMGKLYDDFIARCQLSVEVEGHMEIMDKLEKIHNTVDFLDMSLGDIWTKMDTLANRITVKKGETTKKKKKK